MFYSKSTCGFYNRAIHGNSIPEDAVEISAEQHRSLIEGQSKGGKIVPNADGFPVLQFPPKPTPDAVLEAARVTGLELIDAYGKAQRVKIAGTSDEIEIAGWANKLAIAKAIKAGTASASEKAAFQTEASGRSRGDTVEALADKVIRNADFYLQASCLIDGLKRRAQDAVNAANTPAEVDAVLAAMKSQAEAAFAQLMGATK